MHSSPKALRRIVSVTLAAALSVLVGALAAAPALAVAPEPETFEPHEITGASAYFSGFLPSGAGIAGDPGTYEFLYKATKVVSQAECESAGASKTPVPPASWPGVESEFASQQATGLAPDTEYVVCLSAENGKGERAVGNARSFVTGPEAPETKGATEITGTSVKLEGALKPAGAKLEYYFEYNQGTECTGGSVTPIANGEGMVTAGIGGLMADTPYTFCLVARGAGVEAVGGAKSFDTLSASPSVSEEFVTGVDASDVTLNGSIDPDGRATSYRFEYGPSEAYGASAPSLESLVGSSNIPVSVSVLVEGLSPGTTYHYRVVAHNALGDVEGADQTFSTQTGGASGLLDGRAWEMVSPPAKRGALFEAITGEGGLIQASEGGEALTYIAKAPINTEPPSTRSFADQQLLSIRGAGGWNTQDIDTPNESPARLIAGEGAEYFMFSSDLSVGLVEPIGSTLLSPRASERTPYLRESDGEYEPLVDPANVPTGTKFGGTALSGGATAVKFLGATPDLSHVVVSSEQSLVSGFEAQVPSGGGTEQALYEWNSGSLQPVSILPDLSSAAVNGGAELGDRNTMVRNAISADGNRVIFRTAGEGVGLYFLFMRDMAKGVTLRLDAPEAGAEGGRGGAVFQDASSDGSKVFFTDEARLTVDSTSESNEPDLYMCEIKEVAGNLVCRLKDLTVDRNAGETANVRGTMLGSSKDGSSVYFVANGVLGNGGVPVTGATHGDCGNSELPSQSCNLYEVDTVSGVTRLVAVLSGADYPDWSGGNNENLGYLTARVSANGRFLAFMSQRSLTGYDNHDVVSGMPDEEVYLFDGSSGRVVCASCDPTGARPAGVLDAEYHEPLVDQPGVWTGQWLAASIPGWTGTGLGRAEYQSRYLSDSGRLFFDSPVGLVSSDANGKQDVYEFEPEGISGCSNQVSGGSVAYVGDVAGSQVDGCLGLISGGIASEESVFLDASGKGPGGEEGEDVFFLTAAKLSLADVDDQLDVYDAHVCSLVSPCSAESGNVAPACTTADSCRAATSPQPAIFGAPASSTFRGTGNLVPSIGATVLKPRSLTRAQKLAKVLKECKGKPKKQRAGCEKRARRTFAAHGTKRMKKSRKGGK